MPESPLEEARRHVADAELRVQEQEARIMELRSHRHATESAERLLLAFKQTLQTMRSHLDYEERKANQPAGPFVEGKN